MVRKDKTDRPASFTSRVSKLNRDLNLKRVLTRFTLGATIVACALFLSLSWGTLTPRGRIATLSILKSILSAKSIELSGGELAFSSAEVELRNASICFKESCGTFSSLAISPFSQRLRLSDFCPTFSSKEAPQYLTVESLKSSFEKIRALSLPLHSIVLSFSKSCEYAPGLLLNLSENPESMNIEFNSEVFGSGTIAIEATRATLSASFNNFSLKAEIDSALQGRVNARNSDYGVETNLAFRAGKSGFNGEFSGGANGTFRLTLEKAITAAISNLQMNFQGYDLLIPQVQFEVVERSNTFASVGKVVIATLSGLQLSNDLLSISGGTASFSCGHPESRRNIECALTKGSLSSVSAFDTIRASEVSFKGSVAPSDRCGHLSDISFKLLGGTITGKEISACIEGSNPSENRLPMKAHSGQTERGKVEAPKVHTIRFDQVDLNQIAKLLKRDNLELRGVLDGTMVFTASPLHFNIARFNSSGGDIRLNSESSALPELARQALKDFQYSLIQGSLSFTRDGVFGVDVRVEGKSPALKTTRPVHLNVTWEENIRELINVWKVTQDLRRDLESRGLF